MSAPEPDMGILVEWVIFSRRDWDPGRLEGAVLAARNAQWSDARLAAFLVRMTFDPVATPWDLTNAARQPQGAAATVPASREVIAQHMAGMRAQLANRRAS